MFFTVNSETLLAIATYFRVFTKSCGCQLGSSSTACSNKFSKNYFFDIASNCVELNKLELNLVVMGALSTLRAFPSERMKAKTRFMHSGKMVCRNTFCHLYSIGQSRYKAIKLHFNQFGVSPREHGNKHRNPHNTTDISHINYFRQYIQNHASVYGLSLPGRVAGQRDERVTLLPCTTQWRLYTAHTKTLVRTTW